MGSWAGDVTRILEVDGPPEVFWLTYQFTRGPPVPLEVIRLLLDHFGVRKCTDLGVCQGQEVALMMKKTLHGAENLFASWPCCLRPD